MPTTPLPVDPKDEMLSELSKEEGATLEPVYPMTDSQLPIDMGKYLNWN